MRGRSQIPASWERRDTTCCWTRSCSPWAFKFLEATVSHESGPLELCCLELLKKRLWRSIFFLLTFEFLCCLSKKIYLYMQSPKTFRFVHTPPSTTARSSGPTGHGWSLRSVQHFLQPERESSCNFWLFLMSSFLRASVGPAKLNPGFRPVQG